MATKGRARAERLRQSVDQVKVPLLISIRFGLCSADIWGDECRGIERGRGRRRRGTGRKKGRSALRAFGRTSTADLSASHWGP